MAPFGPPGRAVADHEHGFASVQFATDLGRAGTMFVPSAAYAPCQKGQCERTAQTIKNTIRNTVLQLGLDGPIVLRLAGFEASSAANHRPGPSGISPCMMTFGQRLRLYGELCQHGRPSSRHPDADDPPSEMARRFKIRIASKQAIERHHARELVRRPAAARSRVIEKCTVGGAVLF